METISGPRARRGSVSLCWIFDKDETRIMRTINSIFKTKAQSANAISNLLKDEKNIGRFNRCAPTLGPLPLIFLPDRVMTSLL